MLEQPLCHSTSGANTCILYESHTAIAPKGLEVAIQSASS